MPDIERFSQVLVDITRFLRPRLYIMDGIEAMSGNGPRGGDVFPMNVLLLASDPVALDAVFCRLIAIDPEWVPTMGIAREAGLGTYRWHEIEILGDDIRPIARPDFPVKRHPVKPSAPPGPFPSPLRRWLSARPVIDCRSCQRCGFCISQCPVSPKALKWAGAKTMAKPVCDYSRCIRCYCCQEICPGQAISVRVPWLERAVHRLLG